MKKIIIFSLIILGFGKLNSQSNDIYGYPDYEFVVNKFFSKYQFPELKEDESFNFEKTANGYEISHLKLYPQDVVLKRELFYDLKTKEFNDLNFDKITDSLINKNKISNYNSSYRIRMYKINNFYGYDGFYKDIIKKYEIQNIETDTIVYSLGRAYSDYASALINNNSGFAIKEDIYKLEKGFNSLNKIQLNKYKELEFKAIETFEKVEKINPEFETFIGNINTKKSNEYITAFLNLRIYQNELEAKKMLKKGLYNDILIATAKNYLISCDSNAILFVNGDNDTYPLIYLQEQYNFRRDVLIVNCSLLNTYRYIYSLQNGNVTAGPLSIDLKLEQYDEGVNDYAFILDNNTINQEEFISLNKILEFYYNENEATKYQSKKGPINYIPTHNLSINLSEYDAEKLNLLFPYQIKLLSDSINWTINNSYLTKSQLIMLNVIAHNFDKRPIYFAITSGKDAYLGLENYFELEGFAYKLNPLKSEYKYYNTVPARVNSSLLYNKLKNEFDLDFKNKDNFLIRNYKSIFNQIITALIDDNQQNKAKDLLDIYNDKFYNKDNICFYDVYLVESYFKLEMSKDALAINKIILDNYKEVILNESKKKKPDINKIREALFVFNELSKVLEKFEYDELSKEAKDLLMNNYELIMCQ